MSTVDFVVVIIMILSILLGVLRGFTREVLTLVGFVGAALAVIYGLPVVGPMFEGMFKDPTTAHIAAGIALGLVTLIILSLLAHVIAKGVAKAGLGMVDRILGAGFGVARAALVLCLCFIAIRWVSGGSVPTWITDARSAPLIVKGSDRLVAMLPANIQADIQPSDDKAKKEKNDLLNDAQKAADKTGEKIDKGIEKTEDKIEEEKGKSTEPPAKPNEGYDKSERNNLNNLIEKDQKQ